MHQRYSDADVCRARLHPITSDCVNIPPLRIVVQVKSIQQKHTFDGAQTENAHQQQAKNHPVKLLQAQVEVVALTEVAETCHCFSWRPPIPVQAMGDGSAETYVQCIARIEGMLDNVAASEFGDQSLYDEISLSESRLLQIIFNAFSTVLQTLVICFT